MMREAVSGWPLQRVHALRAIRTFHVQQRLAVSKSAPSHDIADALPASARSRNAPSRRCPHPNPPPLIAREGIRARTGTRERF
jgi:hypothetical protein